MYTKKPGKLYTSSQVGKIKKLIPQKGRHRNADEGNVIFATPDKALASIFLVKNNNDSWMEIGYFNDIPYTVINMDKKEFIENDCGGSMYEVASNKFRFEANLGMGDKEWISNDPITVLNEQNYPSALNAMIENNVYVFFVKNETFTKIKRSKDHGFKIMSKLVAELTPEMHVTI